MLLTDYLRLLASQHRRRPRFAATMEALLKQPCAVENLLREMRTAFDLDTAVGAQLDAVGVRVGRTRHVRLPLNAYFSWNTETLGWNEGFWKGRYDPDSGMHSLPDDLYRRLLYAKVAANSWDGTVPDAYAAWEIAFGDTASAARPAGSGPAPQGSEPESASGEANASAAQDARSSIILIQDNQDMSMVVGVAGKNMSTLFEQLLLQGYVPLKPEGVRIAWFALPPEGAREENGDGRLFAWNAASEALAGWSDGAWPRKLLPLAVDAQ